ncbi:glycosyltransferase family 2 protein [Solirhodobacter olei]|uniref:glycosyltransferase family 2 protein n=1 Tax=Solirhodobacter olei TaxID=2493082 RepID=UPI000FDAC910|nr:glycosyltransferase family 2 protein [Solirhodobacter olei]
MAVNAPPVAIVILNWNGWRDTIECLETCLKLHYPRFRIILCDNASTDGSIDRFADWAAGRVAARPEGSIGNALVEPQVPKPVALDIRASAEVSGGTFDDLSPVTLIRTGANLGFAGGNNVGLDFAHRHGAAHFWLLNNDTVADPMALSALVARVTDAPAIGLCGSRIAFYDAPRTLQLAGGCSYHPSLGLARRIAADRPMDNAPAATEVEARLGYVSAASCLVSKAFLEEIGPMTEDYFLYCEEIDWAWRARGRFRLGYAPDSVVYHKAGRSAGSKSVGRGRGVTSSYYLWRARRMTVRRFHSYGLPGLSAMALITSAALLLRGRPAAARATMSGLLGGKAERLAARDGEPHS